MALVPLQRFRPDQSRFSPQASSEIVNCKPTQDGWGPLNALSPISDALPAKPRGAVSVKTAAGAFKIFVGTASDLYAINSATYAFEEISRLTGDYALIGVEFWSYAKWGNFLIATADGADFPQFVDLATSNDFANLTNAGFAAEKVAVVGDFIVFAGIDGDKTKLKWSGVNDMTFWTVGQRGSDEQVFPDGGAIQAIIPQANNALIIQESAIRQMIFDPESGLVFRFVTLDPSRGAFSSRSVVNIGPNDFVYLAKDGFYRGLEARPIGAERFDRWFFNLCASDKYDLVSGVADPFEKVVWWRFEDEGGTNFLLGYDWQLDEPFYSTNDAVELLTAATASFSLEDLDAFGTIDTLLASLDSRQWTGGVPGFAGFTSDFKFGFFDGMNLEAIIETEDKSLNYPRRAISDRITVLVDTDDAEVAIATKETQAAALNFGSFRSRQPGQPFINSRHSGRWHKFKVRIPAGATWENAVGLDVSFSDGGAR